MKRVVILPVILSLLAALPLYSIKKDTKLILDELQKLATKIEKMDSTVTEIANEFSIMKKKIVIIEDRIGAMAKNQADINQGRESLLLSLQFIKEEINELKNSIGKINDKLVSMPAGSMPAGAETGAESTTTVQAPDTIYYTAYSDYIKKNYQYAVAGFKQFLRAYPENTLADNSLYWIGECYYAQKMYREAVNTFTRLINNYSDGDKIPDALLKKGYALIEMGRQTEGIDVLKELTSKFPLSEEASLAQQKIKEVMD
ncbi:MAG: tol-pal system protein YbgF [Candidatus Aminicenantes bacterium]|nr:tol-pal system protein YbgF [Candidatus Aminicenantes bacterium]